VSRIETVVDCWEHTTVERIGDKMDEVTAECSIDSVVGIDAELAVDWSAIPGAMTVVDY